MRTKVHELVKELILGYVSRNDKKKEFRHYLKGKENEILQIYLTLYCLLRTKVHELVKILILKLEGIIKKISYERRNYESVDEKSLS